MDVSLKEMEYDVLLLGTGIVEAILAAYAIQLLIRTFISSFCNFKPLNSTLSG